MVIYSGFPGSIYVGCDIEQVVDGKITNRQAAEVLGLTKRQIIRLKERMKTEGVAGLAHKNRGRIPKHAVPKETKEKVAMLARALSEMLAASKWLSSWKSSMGLLFQLRAWAGS